MKKLARLIVFAALAGCTASIGGSDPDDTVKTLTLTSVDKLQLATFNKYFSNDEALFFNDCVTQYGAQGCTPYANPWSCDTMQLEIKADARIFVTCRKDGRVVHQGLADASDGLHFICRSFDDNSCQVCTDLRGIPLYDSCNRTSQMWRRPGSGWLDHPDAAWLEEPTSPGAGTPENPGTPDNSVKPPEPQEPQTPTPTPGGNGPCDSLKGAKLYADALNAQLALEGIHVVWSIDQEKLSNPKTGFWAKKGSAAGGITCSQFIAKQKGEHHKCVSTKNGRCSFCCFDLKHYLKYGKKTTCRCARITLAAMKKACSNVPPECTNKDEWSAVMMMAYGEATNTLFSPSYQTHYGQAKVSPGVKLPSCRGSPLVLDLDGDGLSLTSRSSGVAFDLMGTGRNMRTAWVRGDDALLALDRNDNGRIDSGAELFGEATAGAPWANGFQALASLDENSDGKVDARDALFGRLLLWRDADGDGRSRRQELTTLRSAGVTSLSLRPSKNPSAVDRHGNELTLQAGFTRADGTTGLMVDVFFDAGEK